MIPNFSDYLQDFEKRSLQTQLFLVLKQDYIIKTLHKLSGELLLQSYIKSQSTHHNPEEAYLYKKELERELEAKLNSIKDSENNQISRLSTTKTNFESYIQTLNLPRNASQKYFKNNPENIRPELIYTYSPVFKGSRILTKDEYNDFSSGII
jgi:hypothetical protein